MSAGLNVGFVGGVQPAKSGGGSSRQLIAILGGADGTWVAPKGSKYTIYAWGGGGQGEPLGPSLGMGGSFCRKTLILAKGDTLTLNIARASYWQNTSCSGGANNTTVTGPGISLTAGSAGVAASGGDLNVNGSAGSGGIGGAAGGDGTVLGKGGAGGASGGSWPGGGGGSSGGVSGGGAVFIVDETP